MRKNDLVIAAVACAVVALCVSTDVFAETTDFGAKDFNAQTVKIRDFLFGSVMKFGAVIGFFYGVFQLFLSSQWKPLAISSAGGLGVILVPKFIDGVFTVSGMLLG